MNNALALTAISLLATLASSSTIAQEKTAVDLINVFEKLTGKHPGFRKAHAKGVCATGEFELNQFLSKYSTSTLFNQSNVPAIIRFSLGGGNPNADERVAGARGMAIQLSLPDGAIHNIVGNSTPVFAAKDPDVFFGLLEALLPDETGQQDPKKIGAYIASHPSTHAAAAWQQTAETPYSFSNTEFFGLHTFFFLDKDDKETKFRWHTTPDAGLKTMDKETSSKMPDTFLKDRLITEFNVNPISYTINVSIGTEEDTNIDPSQAWPSDRPMMPFGKLTLTSVNGAECDNINFDPNVLSAGFKPSADPVLRMRSPAYAISFGKRLSGQ